MQIKIFIIVILSLLNISLSIADDNGLTIGMGLMHFNYAEYDDNNIFLDGESGFIPGAIIKYKQDQGKNYTEWVGKLYGNTIEYDGKTQSGIPLKTKSDAIIVDSYFKGAKKLDNNTALYMGVGYRYWFRNIRSGKISTGQSVNPLLEEYDWFYFLIGVEGDLFSSNSIKSSIDLRLTKMFASNMKINYLGYGVFDNTQVDLGDKLGARIAMPTQVTLGKSSFFLTPYYEIINIGKSNVVRATSGGSPTNYITWEPRSETRNVGIELTWLW